MEGQLVAGSELYLGRRCTSVPESVLGDDWVNGADCSGPTGASPKV